MQNRPTKKMCIRDRGEPQRIGGCDGIVITADAYVGSPFTGLDGDGV